MRPLDIPARALRTPFAGRFRDWAGFMGVHWFRLLPWTMRRWARCVRPRTFLAVVVWLTWRFCAVLSDAGLRRSEVAALTWGELMDAPDGSGRIHVVRSKKDPEAEGAVVAVTAATMRALDAIRPALPDDKARVFPMSESQVSRRVAAAAAGPGRGYSGHSGRVGLAVKMAKAGAPANVAQRQGRWRSADTLARYTRRLAAGEALRYL